MLSSKENVQKQTCETLYVEKENHTLRTINLIFRRQEELGVKEDRFFFFYFSV
jgi:hypothetical protein